MIYLDNSATTKPCPEAVAAMTEALTSAWGNPSSVHSLGIAAEHLLRSSRESVAAKLGAEMIPGLLASIRKATSATNNYKKGGRK